MPQGMFSVCSKSSKAIKFGGFMKRKRRVLGAVVALMMALTLVACGGQKPAPTADSQADSAAENGEAVQPSGTVVA